MSFSSLLRERRLLSGMAQAALANAAGVSLPTVQNLEAGKGNPSVQTLEALFEVLGLRLEMVPACADWDLLARMGVPISTSGLRQDSGQSRFSSRQLADQLRLAAFEFQEGEDPRDPPDRARKRESLEATLLALQSHFPSFFEDHVRGCPVLEQRVPRVPEARHIKLRRVALAGLARYL